MAKKSGKKAGRKGRSAKDDRALLDIGEDLLTAVHLHQAVQEKEVRTALATAHTALVQAAGDLVARIAERFLEEAGVEASRRDRYARWAEEPSVASVDESAEATGPVDQVSQPH